MFAGRSEKTIKKVLIVNRSEIALRVCHACKALGLQTVVVYGASDVGARYVHEADQAYELTGHGFSAYTKQDEILAIAAKAGVDAIHPGYGFLSENAQFARRVIDVGLIWVGPSPESMLLMGDKIQARNLAVSVGVPVVPGQFVNLLEDDHLARARAAVAALGYPVIIKDPRSGGGKAMRKVTEAAEFEAAWGAVVSEAGRMTGSTELLVEKYLEHGRHVEVQVVGDGVRVIHLFERECSIQRRHQKIVEEAPCHFVPQPTLDGMYDAALTLAHAVKYQGVGTVEFMVMPDGAFYFLEMNTRLQVEHSVTEMTTGFDLVALQLEVAQTGHLPYEQKEIRRHGHAIECRIYAEDPSKNFAPSTGVLTHLHLPHGPWMRHDHDLEVGREITPFFDAMIAKLTTYGPTRAIACGYMVDALRQYGISGLTTNIAFLRRLLMNEDFVAGNFDTQTLKNEAFLSQLTTPDLLDPDVKVVAATAVALVKELQRAQERDVLQTRCVEPQDLRGHGLVSRWKGRQWK